MKLSVSLPDEDVAIIDEYARLRGLASRSAVVHHAVQMLRELGLEREYEQAWHEWSDSAAAADWELTAADGVSHVAR